MRHAAQAVSLLLLLVSTAACGMKTAPDPGKPTDPKTTVEVWNQNAVDFNLYVRSPTQRVRLGLATTGTRTFVVPAHLLTTTNMLRFELDPVGAKAQVISEEVQVREGDHIQLTIPH